MGEKTQLKTKHRFVTVVPKKELEKVLKEAQEITRKPEIRREFRVKSQDGQVWADFRIARWLYDEGLPENPFLVVNIRRPIDEKPPFREIWHIDVYKAIPKEIVSPLVKEAGLPLDNLFPEIKIISFV